MNLVDALWGRAKLEGIQWLLLSPASRRALRSQLKAQLSAPAMLGPCRLRRARFKPGRRLRAYYDAMVRVEGTEGYCARPIAVTWSLDGESDRHQGGDDFAGIQAEALRRGVAAPFRQLTADLPDWSMQIQVSPLDAQYLQLVRLSDPRHVRDMLAGVCAAAELGPEQVPASQYTVTAIRYRPGQRHVLRYDPLEPKGETVFAKLYTGEEGARVFRVATQVGEWLAQHGQGVTSVRPLAYVAEDGVVLYPGLSGVPLSDQLRRPGQGVARCLERTGAALHALHHLPPTVAGPLHLHDFAAEVSKIARASDHISVLLPSVGAVIGALLDRARELHDRLPQEPPTFTHGDFKSDHVWAAPGGPTLIDFDTSCLADPAYDVGKFLAHLQLWHATHDQSGLEQVQEKFRCGYAPGAPEERLVRARLYEAVELVKITAHHVPLFDQHWASRTERLIRRAHAVMNDLERTLGLPATPPSLQGFLSEARQRHLATTPAASDVARLLGEEHGAHA